MHIYRLIFIATIVNLSYFANAAQSSDNMQASLPKTTFDNSQNNIGVDFSGVQNDLAGGPIDVVVLGTAHLNGMKDVLPKEHLNLLLDKLANFSPDIIAIESQSGIACNVLKDYQAVYGDTWENYCWDPSATLASLNVTPAQALKKAYQLMDLPKNQINPVKRREMATYFYAAGWSDSATLQWLQLSEHERKATDGVTEQLKEWLDKRISSSNETVSIAAKLGARLGLNYLHPMDDHTADIVYHNAKNEMWSVIQAVWKRESKQKFAYKSKEKTLLGSPEGALSYFRFINTPSSQQFTIDADFGAVARQTDNGNIARRYLSWWQTRGLRMAANVVEATAFNPSAKVLVLVGSSHKAYFDAYLNQMHDFNIVSVESVLK